MGGDVEPVGRNQALPVLIVGGGPVGLALAGDLGWRGVPCLLVEQGDGEIVAQTVELHGHIDGNVGVGAGSALALTATARPNPVRRHATIDFTLPAAGEVTLDVHDVSGRRVATLVRGRREAGHHVAEWDVGPAAPGLYFCRLRAAGRTLLRKVVVGG